MHDVLFLSQEHFNASGTRPIEQDGVEAFFMLRALMEAYNAVPAVSGIGSSPMEDVRDYFGALEYEIHANATAVADAEAYFNRIMKDCGSETHETVIRTDFGLLRDGVRTTTVRKWSLSSSATRQCSSQEAKEIIGIPVAQEIVLGDSVVKRSPPNLPLAVQFVQLEKTTWLEAGAGALPVTSLKVSFRSSGARDMNYVLNSLRALRTLAPKWVNPLERAGGLALLSRTIFVENTTGNAGFMDPFVLKFRRKNADGRTQHVWRVQMTPIDGLKDFKASLLSETDEPIFSIL